MVLARVVTDAEELVKVGDEGGVTTDDAFWSECSVIESSSEKCNGADVSSVDSPGPGIDFLVSCSGSINSAAVLVSGDVDRPCS